MKSRVISIVVPCYNESKTLETIIARVLAADVSGLEREIIIVDDGSQDDSVNIAKSLAEQHPNIRVLEHKINQGKGAALRTGFQAAGGDIILVQDADLEYSPTTIRGCLLRSSMIVPTWSTAPDFAAALRCACFSFGTTSATVS